MKRRKLIARVVDSGDCRHYRKGQEFVLGGFTPKGLCDSAYAALSRDAQTLAYGGALPWQHNGGVQTRCPDPMGAIWELRPADEDGGVTGDALEAAAQTAEAPPSEHWQVETCRGKEGRCRRALTVLSDLKAALVTVARRSGWQTFLERQTGGRILPHHRLKIAVAACPNACTQPQIKDIGLVASRRPTRVTTDCTGCGACEQVCEEEAIAVDGQRARLRPEACLACGDCVRDCPVEAIEAEPLAFRLLVGGRMGRHPAFAKELPCVVRPSDVPAVIARLLAAIIAETRPGDRFHDVVDRLGADRLWTRVEP